MYILKCSDNTFYTGSTWNLEKRLYEHRNGLGENYTKKRLPIELVYFEDCERIDDAYYREKQIQGWSHAKKQALIEQNYDKIHELAKCLNVTSSSLLVSTPLNEQKHLFAER